MQYYFMNASVDLKIIGRHYPQLERMFNGYNALEPMAVFGIYPDGLISSPFPNAYGFKLKYQSKVTDWISGVNIGFRRPLISVRFWELLLQFNLPDLIALDATLEHKDKVLPYKFIYFNKQNPEFIDLSKSKFLIENTDLSEKIDVEIKNAIEIEETLKRLHLEFKTARAENPNAKGRYLRLRELYLNPNSIDKDIFILPFVVFPIISQTLKSAIEEAGISGVRFLQVNDGDNLNLGAW